MLCSSSSSDLFCPSHPLFFPPPAPVLPPFAWLRFPCPDPLSPQRTPVVRYSCCPLQPAAFLGFVFLGWGCWGGGGRAQGVVPSVCWRERTPGLWNVGLKCSPEAKCAINLAQGIPRAGPRSGHRSGAEGPQSTSHITLISLLFPLRHRFPWMAGGERSCCSGGLREHPGCGVSVSRRRGCTYAHIHLVVPV